MMADDDGDDDGVGDGFVLNLKLACFPVSFALLQSITVSSHFYISSTKAQFIISEQFCF